LTAYSARCSFFQPAFSKTLVSLNREAVGTRLGRQERVSAAASNPASTGSLLMSASRRPMSLATGLIPLALAAAVLPGLGTMTPAAA
jgi:hypothetical protein